MVPLSAFSTFGPGTTPLAINHQGPFVATTFSFNLPEGESLGEALTAIQQTMAHLNVPISVHGDFAGTANLYQASLANEPILILAAIIAIYIVLGVLYESYVHPLTILSTLPSAGVGAVLALLVFRMEFSLIALIGVILLIGIVKKNAIMMIDFAIEGQRQGRACARGDLSRLHAALPPHHDDHPGRDHGRHSAGHRHRPGIGTAPAAGRVGGGRACCSARC